MTEYSLRVPFVVCESEGGPYPDQPFVAGVQYGRVFDLLERGPNELRITVYPELVPQLDLLAMDLGYSFVAEPWQDGPDEWAFVTFTRTTPDDMYTITSS
jgi:hypothetical protein